MSPRPLFPNTRAWVAAGEPSDAEVLKACACDVLTSADDPELGDRESEFVISTARPDRDNDVISADGWKLTNYRKNPVVLFAHDYGSLPIARAKNVRAGDGQLRARVHFVEQEVYPFAETIHQMVRRGYLNAASVGFAPIKWTRNEARGGVDFEEQELLEFSIVPVPANADALVELRSIPGLDLAPLTAWARKFVADQRDSGTPAPSGHPLDDDDELLTLLGLARGDRRALHAALGFDPSGTGDESLHLALGLDAVPGREPPPVFDPEAAAAMAIELLRTELPAAVDARLRRHQGRLD